MKNALLLYATKLEDKLKITLTGAAELEEEPIHDFRVCTKKLHTVLSFLEYLSYHQISRRELYKQFRVPFKKTGRIRELQIHIAQLSVLGETTGHDTSFLARKINYQIDRNRPFIREEIKKLKLRIPKFFSHLQGLIEQTCEGRSRHDAAMNYQLQLEKKIQKLVKGENPDLLRIRKLFKQKVYVFDSIQESELLSFYKEFRAEWEILESTMGIWHDQVILLQYLIRGLKWKRLNDEEYKIMMRLIAHLRSSTSRMEKQLIRSIPKIPV